MAEEVEQVATGALRAGGPVVPRHPGRGEAGRCRRAEGEIDHGQEGRSKDRDPHPKALLPPHGVPGSAGRTSANDSSSDVVPLKLFCSIEYATSNPPRAASMAAARSAARQNTPRSATPS
jgi:hypothetical protein